MNPDVYLELFEDEMGLDTMGLTMYYPQLIETIQKRTLPVFSELFPCIYPYIMDPRDNSKKIPDKYGGSTIEFRIEDHVLDDFGLKVMGHGQFYPAYEKKEYDSGYNTMYLGGMQSYGNSFETILLGSIENSTRSVMRQAIGMNPVCELKGPKLLALKHLPDFSPYIIELLVTYPGVNSIQETFKRYFLNLAKFDVGIFLYAKLKYVEDVITPAGNLNLKISDWESYPRDKEDYIKELRSISFPDRVLNSYFTAI